MDSSSSSEEENFVAALLCEEALRCNRRKRKWVHNVCMDRKENGEYYFLFPKLLCDSEKFFQYFRMSYEKFRELLNLIRDDLEKQDTSFRTSIGGEERLAVCLRFLATGDSFRTIAFSYHMVHTTVRSIVHETCEAIWLRLSPIVLPPPTVDTWKSVEKRFAERWNFPNCVGAMDGKHIVIEAPANSGSMFFNYKKTFSVVLLAIVDADYKFIAVDVGAYGKNSDGGILAASAMGEALNSGKFNLPPDKPSPGTNEPVPYVIVGDEAFPLKPYIIRPYPGSQIKNDETKRICNYRISRARRISENVFGIFAQQWRLYQRRIKMKVEHVDNVILATCCLHNFLREDILQRLGNVNDENVTELRGIRNVGGNSSTEAVAVREKFKDYFVSPVGSVPWQIDMVRQGRRNL